MGNINSVQRINFEQVQDTINNNNPYLLINVLDYNQQDCLIHTTIHADKEELEINNCIRVNKEKKIIIYGKNCNDDKIFKKYKQLKLHGFKNIYLYLGGLFEWLCLQDIYGKEQFKTVGYENDLLKYK
tara:strand:- start:5484 stop:5867 length:384 start_codon:yes stop_codon:yes gene_type:complete